MGIHPRRVLTYRGLQCYLAEVNPVLKALEVWSFNAGVNKPRMNYP